MLKSKIFFFFKLLDKRHKVRRQTKLLYFFLSEYQKCIETYMK